MTDLPRPPGYQWTPPAKHPWMQHAACRDTPVEMFFGPQEGGAWDPTPALALCRSCPVRLACLEYGLGERHGIWGGLTPAQRRQLRRQRRSAA